MKGEINASISAVTAAVMLVACASKEPANPGRAAAGAQDETSAGYQRLAENARKQIVCKRQAVLGTRVDNVVCMTRAEMKDQQEHANEVMRDLRQSAPMNRQPVPPPPPPSASPK
jgi:hypothetical protein